MNRQTFSLLLAGLLAAGSVQAQKPAVGEPVKPAPSDVRPVKETDRRPVKEEAGTRPVKGEPRPAQAEVSPLAEPAENLDDLTSAEKCRAYAEQKTAWLDTEVGGLSADQRRELKGLFETAYLDIKALRDEAKAQGAKDGFKEDAKARLSRAKREAVDLLTPEQAERLDGWRDGRNATRKDGAMDRVEEQTRELDAVVNLSPDQRREVQDLHARLWKEAAAWRDANPGATADEKKAYAREQLQARMEAYRSILTPEQQETYKASRKGGMDE
jgi:hypothetical protein